MNIKIRVCQIMLT